MTSPKEDNDKSVDPVAELLGADPWLRFDLWASRSWEAAENAVEAARSSEGAGNEFSVVVSTLIHAAQVAKDFAGMVNPVLNVDELTYRAAARGAAADIAEFEMFTENDDLD